MSAQLFRPESETSVSAGSTGELDLSAHKSSHRESDISLQERFYALVTPPLGRGSGMLPLERLHEILSNSADRAIIFSFVCEHGFPATFSPTTVQCFAEAAFAFTDSDKDVAWNVICAAIEYATSSRIPNLSESLLREICSRTAPEWMVAECVHIFCDLHCTGINHAPELRPWIQLFHEQGSQETFETIHTELLSRLNRGELSCYEHLVAALCENDNENSLSLVRHIIKKIHPTSRPSQRLTPLAIDALAMGIRLIPMSAILVMVSAGPEHTFSPTTVLLSAALGSCLIAYREIMRTQNQMHNQQRETPAYSYITFAEKALKTLQSQQQPSAKAQEVVQEISEILAMGQKSPVSSTD